MKKLTPLLNKFGLGWNLPYWSAPYFGRWSKTNSGVWWYWWLFRFWTYTEDKRRYYCIRLFGFQIQTNGTKPDFMGILGFIGLCLFVTLTIIWLIT